MAKRLRVLSLLAVVIAGASLGGCATTPMSRYGGQQLSDRECMARVMYFESNRSSEDGMAAVGTVVMNRLQSPKYPKTVCGVVGQQNQFAEGALTNRVNRRSSSWARAEATADAVMAGRRHDGVGNAMFFHTAGYTFPYRNMKYVTLAGGNVFYEKQRPGTFTPGFPWERKGTETMLAAAEERTRTVTDKKPRPAPVIVAALRTPAKPTALAHASTPAASPRQIAMAAPAASPPTRPKPIVVAMLSTPRSHSGSAPRSISDLIEMDLKQR